MCSRAGVGGASAAALTTISVEGQIDFVDAVAAPNLLGIEVGDPFSIEAIYNELLLSTVGLPITTVYRNLGSRRFRRLPWRLRLAKLTWRGCGWPARRSR